MINNVIIMCNAHRTSFSNNHFSKRFDPTIQATVPNGSWSRIQVELKDLDVTFKADTDNRKIVINGTAMGLKPFNGLPNCFRVVPLNNK